MEFLELVNIQFLILNKKAVHVQELLRLKELSVDIKLLINLGQAIILLAPSKNINHNLN